MLRLPGNHINLSADDYGRVTVVDYAGRPVDRWLPEDVENVWAWLGEQMFNSRVERKAGPVLLVGGPLDGERRTVEYLPRLEFPLVTEDGRGFQTCTYSPRALGVNGRPMPLMLYVYNEPPQN